ncbi:hypothetical protein NIES3585_16960 [Nodularia sp. NIES-3585]|nr:hypothetical protein NIES3585_16960 [Nodularia sp. NIES-3585]
MTQIEEQNQPPDIPKALTDTRARIRTVEYLPRIECLDQHL